MRDTSLSVITRRFQHDKKMHTPLALCDMMQARVDVIFVFESLYDTGSMHMGIFILECGGIVEVMTDNYRPQLFILC